jgi:RNA polymerase sigma factor (sigma-70 family)
MRTQSDERLVDLTRAGNEAAFEAIVHRYRRELLRYCARVLPASRTEDAVQQVFASAHRSLLAGSADIALRPWLYRIAHNQAITMLRQNGWDNEPMTEDAEGVDESPAAVHERRQELRDAIAALRELPERQRDALILRELEGRSYDDVAAQLGVSGGAARQLVLRARSTLRAGVNALTPPFVLTAHRGRGRRRGRWCVGRRCRRGRRTRPGRRRDRRGGDRRGRSRGRRDRDGCQGGARQAGLCSARPGACRQHRRPGGSAHWRGAGGVWERCAVATRPHGCGRGAGRSPADASAGLDSNRSAGPDRHGRCPWRQRDGRRPRGRRRRVRRRRQHRLG